MTNARYFGILRIIPFLIVACCLAFPARAQYGGGTGEPNDPYLIYSAGHLNAIGAEPNDWDKHFKLMADVDLGGFGGSLFNLIGDSSRPFSGTFDGNGHTVSNFTCVVLDVNETEPGFRDSETGLFRYVLAPAEIRDLGLIDPNIRPAFSSRTGALVGVLGSGFVINCYVEGGNVWGYNWSGGLVGVNGAGTISGCRATCDVSCVWWPKSDLPIEPPPPCGFGGLVGSNSGRIHDCWATGDVQGAYATGGLVGQNSNSGCVIPTTISVCFATGKVSGTQAVGGLVGENWKGTIQRSCATGTVCGEVDVGGLVGAVWGGIWIIGDPANPPAWDGVDPTDPNWSAWFTFPIVENCYAAGSVSGRERVGGLVGSFTNGWISNCYATSNVVGKSWEGGLIGGGCYSPVTSCFWDTESAGTTTSAGGTGLTTAEMQTAAMFLDAGWDFVEETENGTEEIWWIREGRDYPRLAWERLVEDVVVLVVDDFESYTNEVADRVFRTWIDGRGFTLPEPGHPGNGTGAMVGHDLWDPNIPHPYQGFSIIETKIVHGGWQSMPLSYDNTTEPYYSEAERAFTTPGYWTPDGVESPQDWTAGEADTLTLYFHGEADNDPESLYVAIEDSARRVAAVTHPDADAVQATEWQKWHIALADLQAAGVDVASVRKIIIGLGDRDNPREGGTGTIYIDDITVTRRMP